MISLRSLLSKLTVLALSASPAAAATSAAPAADSADCQSADDGDFDLDEDVPIDLRHIDAEDATVVLGRSLAKALSEMKPLEAIHLSTTWALSKDPVRRGAIASALEWVFPLMPDRLIIEHLSKDPDPLVRSACVKAAWIRGLGGEHRV